MDAYQCLDSLRQMLRTRRQDLMERMARGLGPGVAEENYREHVGRCKELSETIEKISSQIKSLNGEDDDDTQKRPKL